MEEKKIIPLGVEVFQVPGGNPDRQMIEVEKALKKLKKKCEKEGIVRLLRDRQYYRKPSEIKREHDKKVRKTR